MVQLPTLSLMLLGCLDVSILELDETGRTDSEPPCVDADGDTVCDAEDLCPGQDDLLDSDGDGAVDCQDPCPEDLLDDSDGDGVCDSDDVCPGGDDAADEDGDGVCDDLDACPGYDDGVDDNLDGTPDACERCKGSGGFSLADADGDGLPDDCKLAVLFIWYFAYTSDGILAQLEGRGWTVDSLKREDYDPSALDFADYDVVALSYPEDLAHTPEVLAANDAGQVGLLIHRGGDNFQDADLGLSSWYQEGDCSVTATPHFITEPFGAGPLSVGYRYKTLVQDPDEATATLVACPDPSLVIHPTLRRLTTTYYGHPEEMPWSEDGELLDLRSYAWAAGFGD